MAVDALEFIEVGTDFDLVLSAFEQVVEDSAMLEGCFHILLEPGAAGWTVKQPISLDVLRLAINLGQLCSWLDKLQTYRHCC